jgi:tRNA pseudouridine38-40 synthase
MRLALKFGYDGRRFHGFSRQPGQRTVEGEILEALRGLRILAPSAAPREIGYGAASRTDAGVSAIGNVLALDTAFRKDALLRALNARLEDVWFHSIAEVPEGFQPRHAMMRWYRYHLMSDEVGDWSRLRTALRLFAGKHDFTNFCRPEGRSAVRSIRKVATRRSGQFIAVDFFSQGFLWNQVRRMVGAALGVSRGELKLAEVKRALDRPKTKADLGLAPAEPLLLMDVAYDFDFTHDEGALGLAARGLQKKRREAIQTMVMASYFVPATGTSPSGARRPSRRPR